MEDPASTTVGDTSQSLIWIRARTRPDPRDAPPAHRRAGLVFDQLERSYAVTPEQLEQLRADGVLRVETFDQLRAQQVERDCARLLELAGEREQRASRCSDPALKARYEREAADFRLQARPESHGVVGVVGDSCGRR